MSTDHLKTPLMTSLQALGKGKAQEQGLMTGRAYPCTVAKVISSGIVLVNFEINATPFTLPKVKVPVQGSQYVRYPIQVGDKGFCVPADARLGAITGMSSTASPPDLTQPGNLAALTFVWLGNVDWPAALDPNAVEINGVGTSGVILRSGDSATVVTLTSTGIAITLGGTITINSAGHNVTITGGGDVLAGTISLKDHTHSGVTTGSGNTGAPVP